MKVQRWLLSSVATIGALATAQGAQAQQASQDSGIGEVIITAQKRTESLQDVPVAVSAFTAQLREETGIITTQQQLNFTPGVTYSATADRVAIRGIGRQTNALGTDPGVAVYNDGFYQPTLGDVGGSTLGTSRIEVLRGPQGTLYGRNSIGGAINVISRRPGDEFEAEVRAAVNNYERTTFEGRIAGPLGDGLSASLMGLKIDQDDGYFDNLYPGAPDEGGVTDLWAVEGQIAWEITPRFDVWARLRTGGYDNRDRSSSMISQYDYGYSLENVPTPTFDLGPTTVIPPRVGLNISNPSINDPRVFLANRPSSNTLDDYYLFVTEANYRFDNFDFKYIGGFSQYDAKPFDIDGERGPSPGFQWPLSNNWFERSFDFLGTGYVQFGELLPADNSGVTIPVSGDVRTFGRDEKNVWSHEINISSSGDGPFQWLFGLYYYQEADKAIFKISFPNDPVFDTVYPLALNPLALRTAALGLAPPVPPFGANTFYGAVFLAATTPALATGIPNPTRDGYGNLADLDTRSSAVFAQFDYDFSSQLHGTFGIRYSHDEKEGREQERVPAWYPFFIPAGTELDLNGDGTTDILAPDLCGACDGGAGGVIVNYVADIGTHAGQTGFREDSWNHVTATAGLQWTPNDDTNVYGRYSHGYKSGGFNLGTFKPVVNPETIDTWELGWKQQFGDVLQLNTSIFYNNYHDMQTVIQIPVGPGVATTGLINLNEVRTQGLEIETVWAVTDNLRLMANYAFLDTEILSACCYVDNADPFAGPQELAGNRMPFSPEQKFALNATYTMNFSSGTLSLSATENVRTGTWYTVFNTDNYRMRGFDTTDFRAVWTDANDRFSIIGTITNAFDEDAITSFDTTSPQTSSQTTIGLEPPRIYALEFQYRF